MVFDLIPETIAQGKGPSHSTNTVASHNGDCSRKNDTTNNGSTNCKDKDTTGDNKDESENV